MNPLVDDFCKTDEFFDVEAGTAASGKVNRNGYFYHATCHSFNDNWIFNFETAAYRQQFLNKACLDHHVVLLYSACQPTHSHDVFMCRSFDDVVAVLNAVNPHFAHFVKTTMPKRFSIPGTRVFRERPRYRVIDNRQHLLYLAKYIYDNGAELRSQGKRPPYCCFDDMEKGYFKGYSLEIYEKLFGVGILEIIKKCKELDSSHFISWAKSLFQNITSEEEKMFFFSKCDVSRRM